MTYQCATVLLECNQLLYCMLSTFQLALPLNEFSVLLRGALNLPKIKKRTYGFTDEVLTVVLDSVWEKPPPVLGLVPKPAIFHLFSLSRVHAAGSELVQGPKAALWVALHGLEPRLLSY